MPQPGNVKKATLVELNSDGTENSSTKLEVQFNPETLKVTYTNQTVPPHEGGASNQNENSTAQFVGKGVTKLSVQIWFDVSAQLQGANAAQDVRTLTTKVIYFITPKEQTRGRGDYLPPAVRFQWGTFTFEGVAEAMDESLEFFSPDGVPLRASMTLNLSQQKIEPIPPSNRGQGMATPAGTSQSTPGTQPLTQATAGVSLQAMVDAQGGTADWQSIAQANGIENPRQIPAGTLINLNINNS